MRILRKGSFFFFFVIQYVIISAVICTENDEEYLGIKGITKERIKQFEEIIRENSKVDIPKLEVVKRKKPYITRFPMTEGDEIVTSEHEGLYRGESVEYSDQEGDLSYKSEDEVPLSSDVDDIVIMSDVDKQYSDESKEEIDPRSELEVEVDENGDLVSHDEVLDVKSKEEGSEDEVIEKELTKAELKKKKAEEKRLEKERQKEEKKLNKQKKNEEKKKKAAEKAGGKGGFRNIFKKRNVCVGNNEDDNDEKCIKRGRKLLEDTTVSSGSTVGTESGDSGESSGVYDKEASEGDTVIEKRTYGIEEFGSEDGSDEELKGEFSDSNEIDKAYLSLSDSEFRTERISSEELQIDNDSDYTESTGRDEKDDIEEGRKYKKFTFSDESEDIISAEKAVESLEDIEIESLTEGDDYEGNLGSDIRQRAVSSDSDFMSNESSEATSIDNESVSRNKKIISSMDEINDSEDEEIDSNESVDAKLSDKYGENVESSNKISVFFRKIKNAFKRKPNLTPNKECGSTKCVDKGIKSRLKYTKDFVPKIYLLSRNVPRDELYSIPEISSSLRSESNRMVFAYQLMDGNLIPSSSLASSSKSFITRRWGKKIQRKLVRLREEFDKLKSRLSEMYHEGVVRGEFELFIEEIDDLTIMLYFAAKEFPSSTKFSNIARDILRFPEVVASPGERLLSIFKQARKSSPKCERGRCKESKSSLEQLEIKKLRKRMGFIKKRYNSLN
ncbi:hypothetical protein FG386_003390 [Cryptosporidium ryanae]|uniref:uncharacterized protein n=1 Tax=Cryptosporidium ryanae TaxID=515981 RepID=UPI00351A6FD4|nr:hypothetical protein FG386_003390 [Cryptosporidium ryanae]